MMEDYKLLRGNPTYTITNGEFEFILLEREPGTLNIRVRHAPTNQRYETLATMYTNLNNYVNFVPAVLERNFPQFYSPGKKMSAMTNDLLIEFI